MLDEEAPCERTASGRPKRQCLREINYSHMMLDDNNDNDRLNTSKCETASNASWKPDESDVSNEGFGSCKDDKSENGCNNSSDYDDESEEEIFDWCRKVMRDDFR